MRDIPVQHPRPVWLLETDDIGAVHQTGWTLTVLVRHHQPKGLSFIAKLRLVAIVVEYHRVDAPEFSG